MDGQNEDLSLVSRHVVHNVTTGIYTRNSNTGHSIRSANNDRRIKS